MSDRNILNIDIIFVTLLCVLCVPHLIVLPRGTTRWFIVSKVIPDNSDDMSVTATERVYQKLI